jgi:hypothetical protein
MGDVKLNPKVLSFFKLPGQRLQEYAAEVKLLTDRDKEQLNEGFENGTMTY